MKRSRRVLGPPPRTIVGVGYRVVPLNPGRAPDVQDADGSWPRRVPPSIRLDPLWRELMRCDAADVIRKLDAVGLLDDDERAAWAPMLRDRNVNATD